METTHGQPFLYVWEKEREGKRENVRNSLKIFSTPLSLSLVSHFFFLCVDSQEGWERVWVCGEWDPRHCTSRLMGPLRPLWFLSLLLFPLIFFSHTCLFFLFPFPFFSLLTHSFSLHPQRPSRSWNPIVRSSGYPMPNSKQGSNSLTRLEVSPSLSFLSFFLSFFFSLPLFFLFFFWHLSRTRQGRWRW